MNRPDPFATWKANLAVNIGKAIAVARRDGTTAMGEDTLRNVTRIPFGGPVGPNARYFYATAWFPEALATRPARDRAFVMKEAA